MGHDVCTYNTLYVLEVNMPYMDVSKNTGKTPKWMVKIMEKLIKIDDLGGFPTIFGNTQICLTENHGNVKYPPEI